MKISVSGSCLVTCFAPSEVRGFALLLYFSKDGRRPRKLVTEAETEVVEPARQRVWEGSLRELTECWWIDVGRFTRSVAANHQSTFFNLTTFYEDLPICPSSNSESYGSDSATSSAGKFCARRRRRR